MRKRKGHKPVRIRSGRRGGVECGVRRNYYWIRGKNVEMNGWGELDSHALLILRTKLGMREETSPFCLSS